MNRKIVLLSLLHISFVAHASEQQSEVYQGVAIDVSDDEQPQSAPYNMRGYIAGAHVDQPLVTDSGDETIPDTEQAVRYVARLHTADVTELRVRRATLLDEQRMVRRLCEEPRPGLWRRFLKRICG